MEPKIIEIKLARFHEINVIALYLSLLGWIIAISVLLYLNLSNEGSDFFYKPISAILLIAITINGISNIWFALIKEFGLDTIIKTVFSLAFGLIGLSAISADPNAITYFIISTLAYLAIIGGIYTYYFVFKEKLTAKEKPITTDVSIRGIQSIFFTGQNDYKYVRRCNLENKSPAKKFEARFVRYLERKLKRNIYSMFGDNVNYWRFATHDDYVDFIICAQNFNITKPVNAKNKWLLRIRESAPYTFSKWISAHFPEGSGVTRTLISGHVQVQFPSSALISEDEFFKVDIPALTDESFMLAAIGDYHQKQAEAEWKMFNSKTKTH
ncbi:MAG: hypothetical protein JKX76_08610 [Colwellia sp.]|nr:hypothetical protein [Colwellia sp.]